MEVDAVTAGTMLGDEARRHPHVDVVGEVPSGVVRHHPEAREPCLADDVGGPPAILRAFHPAVLCDRPAPG